MLKMKTLNNLKALNIKSASAACVVVPFVSELMVSSGLPAVDMVTRAVLCACAIYLMIPSAPKHGISQLWLAAASFLVFTVISLSCSSSLFAPLPAFIALALVLCLKVPEIYSERNLVAWGRHMHDALLLLDDWAIALSSSLLYMLSVLSDGVTAVQAMLLLLSLGLYLLIVWRSVSGGLMLMGRKRRLKLNRVMGRAWSSPKEQKADDDEMMLMRELFDRIVVIMEERKPFLSESYCMSELSAEVYTNKLYLSKAINIMTGQNFRQFINTYRVNYSRELMHKNKDLKVQEVSVMSGFHSPVTFGMAFKLNFGETPGEYLQKLRAGLEQER